MVSTILLVAAILSVSPGLVGSVPVGVTECAEVVKLTLSRGGKITHVRPMSSAGLGSTVSDATLIIEPSTVRPILAYTIQGPGSEVGIVLCGAGRVSDSDPDPGSPPTGS